MKIRTNTQLEGILRMAFCLDGNSIKDVSEMTGINRNTETMRRDSADRMQAFIKAIPNA